MKATLLTAAALLAGGADAAEPKYQPKIAIEKARAIALERVPGTVVEEELEHEKGRWVYEFEIKPKQEGKAKVKEVEIDPETGAVLAVADEGADDAEDETEKDEDDKDDKEDKNER